MTSIDTDSGEMMTMDTDIGDVIIRRSEYSHADGSIKYRKSLYLHSNGDICMFLSSTPPHTSTCTESRRKQMRAMCYETCRNQMIKDFGNEGPLWKLTCYGHVNYGPCDIVGDTSYEELRALAYEDAKSGLCLEAIVERERCSLMVQLCKFDGALTSRKHRMRCCSPPPQEVPWTIPIRTSESKENISSTGTVAEITNYTSRIMPPLTNLANIQSSIFPKGLNAASFEITGSNASQKAQNLIVEMPKGDAGGCNSIWFREEWVPAEIPEAAPPDEYVR